MLRLFVIIALSVLTVVYTGCDKIKTELERRHLGSETHNEAALATPNAAKTISVKQDDVKETSKRRLIVFRIDLPADEKIQIRLIKNSAPEETSKNGAAASPNETLKAAQIPPETAELPRDKPERPAASIEKKSTKELDEQKDEESKSEIKTETDRESRSEMKTDEEDVSPPPPLLAPTVVVPAEETTSQPALPDMKIKNSLASSKSSEPAPADKAVGLALSVTSPETNNKAQNAASSTDKQKLSSPWAIPDAEYPLRYY